MTNTLRDELAEAIAKNVEINDGIVYLEDGGCECLCEVSGWPQMADAALAVFKEEVEMVRRDIEAPQGFSVYEQGLMELFANRKLSELIEKMEK